MCILGLSPLILGPSLLGSNIQQQLMVGTTDITREILKDIEDVEVGTGVKQTLPLGIGTPNSKRIAYGMVGFVNAALIFSTYY